MKILYCLNSGNFGGMEQHVTDLVAGMVAKRHEVHVWCGEGPLQEMFKELGAQTTLRNIKFDIDHEYIGDLTNYLTRQNIDLIHTHELKAGINGLIAGKIAGTKTKISHIHTPLSEWPDHNIFMHIKLFLEKKLYSFMVNTFATLEIALTESRKQLKLQEGIKVDKLKVIPNGIDLNKFVIAEEERYKLKQIFRDKYKIPQEAIIIGNISRVTEEKGHKILVEAFSQIYKKNKNVYLLLAGGGILENEIRNMANDLNISQNVIITGRFSDEDKIKYYSALDIFVFPSLAEGFGIVILEAMAFGLPLICSDLPVFKEIDNAEISFFKTKDALDLAEKLQIGLSSKVKLKTNEEIRAKLSKWSLEKFIYSYNELYENLNART